MDHLPLLARFVAAATASLVLARCSDGRVVHSPNPFPTEALPSDPAPSPPSLPSHPGAPPLSGGTLVVSHDGLSAIAADPDRDAVYVADLEGSRVRFTVPLNPGDEPGRLVEDAARRVHVVLRRGGAVVSLSLDTGAVVARRPVCAAPRGIAYDDAHDALHVACADGTLVTLPAAGGDPTRTLHLADDLRDVVVDGDSLLVSRFRSAQIIRVAADGGSSLAPSLPAFDVRGLDDEPETFVPEVAWRMVAMPGGGAAVIHQRARSTPIVSTNGVLRYDGTTSGGGPRGGVVQGVVSLLPHAGAPTLTPPLSASAALAVDLSVARGGRFIAWVAAGNTPLAPNATCERCAPTASPDGRPQLWVASAAALVLTPADLSAVAWTAYTPGGAQAVAVAFLDDGSRVVVQTRQPAALHVMSADGTRSIALAAASVADEGHALFHTDVGGGVTCASCHPEGGDDGHVWNFSGIGPRRTQSLRGGILGTEPFHWGGTLADFAALTDEVMVRRMRGPSLSGDQQRALASWVDALPVPARTWAQDPPAVARGQALFTDPGVGCSGCHSGPHFTSNQTLDVGTGGSFQVPRLTGLAWHAPYLHDGSLATLRDRFGAGGGGEQHGHTAQLQTTQIDDLIAYLGSL